MEDSEVQRILGLTIYGETLKTIHRTSPLSPAELKILEGTEGVGYAQLLKDAYNKKEGLESLDVNQAIVDYSPYGVDLSPALESVTPSEWEYILLQTVKYHDAYARGIVEKHTGQPYKRQPIPMKEKANNFLTTIGLIIGIGLFIGVVGYGLIGGTLSLLGKLFSSGMWVLVLVVGVGGYIYGKSS